MSHFVYIVILSVVQSGFAKNLGLNQVQPLWHRQTGLKSRDIPLPTKVHIVKTMFFSSSHVWMRKLGHKEGWAPKNWCFQTVVLEKTLESPLDYRRSKQSIVKEISPGYSLEGLMLKLKLLYFGRLMWRANSLEKILMLGRLRAGREGADRGWDGWMASPTQWTWVWINSGCWQWARRPVVLRFMGSRRVRHDWATELNLLLCEMNAIVQ